MRTEAQGDEGRLCFIRQGEALTRWRRDHPDYEVRVIKEMISGRENVKEGLLGRFLEDAQKGKDAPGTILLLKPSLASVGTTCRAACSS